jgi:hypothetical protein
MFKHVCSQHVIELTIGRILFRERHHMTTNHLIKSGFGDLSRARLRLHADHVTAEPLLQLFAKLAGVTANIQTTCVGLNLGDDAHMSVEGSGVKRTDPE